MFVAETCDKNTKTHWCTVGRYLCLCLCLICSQGSGSRA